MKNLLILLSFIGYLSVTGCKKDVTDPLENGFNIEHKVLPQALSTLNFLQKPTNGYLRLKSYTTQASSNPSYVVDAVLYDANGDPADFGAISVGNNSYTANSKNFNYYGGTSDPSLANLFGTSVSIQAQGLGISATLPTPTGITVSSPVFKPSASGGTFVGAGTTITWNSSTNNPFGVGIAVEYDGAASLGGSQKLVQNTIKTSDSGSYTFTSADFANIPSGVDISVVIGRGNYVYASGSSGKSLGIYTYSVMSCSYKH